MCLACAQPERQFSGQVRHPQGNITWTPPANRISHAEWQARVRSFLMKQQSKSRVVGLAREAFTGS